MSATSIELALHRSKLLRANIAMGALQDACAVASRHVARLERIRLTECNGIEEYQGPNRPKLARGLTDAEQEKFDRQRDVSRKALQDALRPFLTPGCVWKFYPDPRANVCRISSKDNRRDAFL